MPTGASSQTTTAKLNEQGRVVIPKEIRQALGVSAGDQVIFTLSGSGEVSVTSAQAVRRTVWANNCGGDAEDSTLAIRAQRMVDQQTEARSRLAMEADEQEGASAEPITTEDLLGQLE